MTYKIEIKIRTQKFNPVQVNFPNLQQGAVQWMKNGFGLGNDRNQLLDKRYSMEGRVSQGEYNLRIINVQMDDDDEYACQVEAANENPTRLSSPAKLTVLGKLLVALETFFCLCLY